MPFLGPPNQQFAADLRGHFLDSESSRVLRKGRTGTADATALRSRPFRGWKGVRHEAIACRCPARAAGLGRGSAGTDALPPSGHNLGAISDAVAIAFAEAGTVAHAESRSVAAAETVAAATRRIAIAFADSARDA